MSFALPLVQQILAAGLMEPVEEFRFSPPRKFAFDLAWPEHKAACEKEGGIFGRGKKCPLCKRRSVGAHTSIERLLSDMEKYNLAAVQGWRVIRVTPDDIESGQALRWIEALLKQGRAL